MTTIFNGLRELMWCTTNVNKSDILNKKIRLNVSKSALKTVDFKGGLDKFLKSAKNKNLSSRVKKLKFSIVSKT